MIVSIYASCDMEVDDETLALARSLLEEGVLGPRGTLAAALEELSYLWWDDFAQNASVDITTEVEDEDE